MGEEDARGGSSRAPITDQSSYGANAAQDGLSAAPAQPRHIDEEAEDAELGRGR